MNNEKNNLGVNSQLPPMGSSTNQPIQNNFNNFSNFNDNVVQPVSNDNVSVFDLMTQFSNVDNSSGVQSQVPGETQVQQPPLNIPPLMPLEQSQVPSEGQGHQSQNTITDSNQQINSNNDESNVQFTPPTVSQEQYDNLKNDIINNNIITSDIIIPEEPKKNKVKIKEQTQNNDEESKAKEQISSKDESKVESKNKKINKKLIIIVLIVLVLVGLGVILYFMLFNKNLKTSKVTCVNQSYDDKNNYETSESITLNFKGDKLSEAEIDHYITFHDTSDEQKAALLANFKNEYEGRGKEFSSIEDDKSIEFIVTYEPDNFKNLFGMDDYNMKKDNIVSTLKNNGYTCD